MFRDQISGWLFDQADRLSDDQNASVAILSLMAPYFETISCYLKGRAPGQGESSTFLRDGIEEGYPRTAAVVKQAFVTEIRNGLFHESIFRRVLLHKGGAPSCPSFDMVNEGGSWRRIEEEPRRRVRRRAVDGGGECLAPSRLGDWVLLQAGRAVPRVWIER